MNKTRLSKLQKWILQRTFEKGSFGEKSFKKYFDVEKLNTAQRVTKHRCLKNIISKGFIEKYESKNDLGRYFCYKLTPKGFDLLIANKLLDNSENVSFKDYTDRFDKFLLEYLNWAKTLALMIGGHRK